MKSAWLDNKRVPYALFLTPPSQILAHHHLIHRIVALKTGKMPGETVLGTKIQIHSADSEDSGQIVTLTMKFLPESSEVVVGITLETHHLAQETCAPGFRRLFLLRRQSPATAQPRGTRKSACSKRFHSLYFNDRFGLHKRCSHLQKTEDAFCVRCLTAPPLCAPGSITDPINFPFHSILWPRTTRVSPSVAMELLQWGLSKPTSTLTHQTSCSSLQSWFQVKPSIQRTGVHHLHVLSN